MSNMERNKGVLTPVPFTEEDALKLIEAAGEKLFDDYDNAMQQVLDDLGWYTQELVKVGKRIYKVVWEVEGDTDYPDFADVERLPNGDISFHTYHYNGGAHWTEVVEGALK